MIPTTKPHWQDQHSGPLNPDHHSARAAWQAGLAAMPGWARIALRLRNRAMALFGLKTTESGDELLHLPVLEDSPDRYCAGMEDRHLTFTLLTERDNGQVRITTSIWFNHWTGRLYLAAVLIPHKLIVRASIRGLE